MQIKCKMEIEEEPSEDGEYYGTHDQICGMTGLQEIKNESCAPCIDINSEIKAEALDFWMEELENEQISEAVETENQFVVEDCEEKAGDGQRSSGGNDDQELRKKNKGTEKHDGQEYRCANCDFTFGSEDEFASHFDSLCKGKVISVLKIVSEIFNNSELKREILCAPGSDYDINKAGCKWDRKEQWNGIVEKKAVVILENLGLPKQLHREVMGIVLLIGMKMLTWAEYHEGILCLSREYSISFLSSSFFTSNGIIDNKRAAEELIKDDNLSSKQKYKLACLYCFTERIPTLFGKLTKNGKEEFYNSQNLKLVKFWSYYLMGEIDKLKGEKRIDQYRLEKAVESGNKAAVEYCLEKTDLRRKENAIIDAAIETVKSGKIRLPWSNDTRFDCFENDSFIFQVPMHKDNAESWIPSDYYVDILHFLLSKMSNDQKIEFLKKDIEGCYKKYDLENSKYSRALGYFLNWPYQSDFIKIVKLMWEFLPEKSYANVLLTICNKIQPKREENLKWGEERSFNYRDLLREFWCQSPEHYKRYVFSDEQCQKDLFLKLFETETLTSSIDEKNVELIKLILNDATPKEKEGIIYFSEWGALCNKLIIEGKWELLEGIIEKCISSREQINQFKKEFFLCWDALSYLVGHDKFSLMDEVEKWSTRSEEETKEHKRKNILSKCGILKCFDLIMEDKLEFVNKFVRWSLTSEEEIKDFKKDFAYSYGYKICEDLIAKSYLEDIYDDEYCTIGSRINFQGGKWEQVEMFLTWTFSSEEEIRKFKMSELELVHTAIPSQLIEANRWEEAETFCAWLDLSKEEIKEIKKETLLDCDMFNGLLYNEDNEEFLTWGISKEEAIELFLRWCFLDKETLLKFQDEFFGEMNEERRIAFRDLDLAIEQRLSDLAEEEKGVKRKTEDLDSPDEKICSTTVDQ